jgi:hypothetical protein
MADIFDTTGNKTYSTLDPGGNLEVAGPASLRITLDEFIERHGGINVPGFDGSREKAAAVKKAVEDSLASGYVKYETPGMGRDAQEDFIKQNAGKARLRGGYADAGLYSAEMIGPGGEVVALQGKTNDPAMKGTPLYDENATSKKSFFDATGRRLSASEVANTETGKGFAAAGWDIGFGPGMIAPGVKADTTARDAYRAAKETTVSQSSRVVEPKETPVTSTPLTPATISPVATVIPPPPVKTAPIDTILFNDESVPVEIMADLIFENIGGQELINIARNDTVNGQNILYQPIKNLTAIQQQYNPNNIVSLQATSDKYFQNFSIKFEEKVPLEATGPAGAHIYVDTTTGELVIESVNMLADEQIELEVTASGTIYEADI